MSRADIVAICRRALRPPDGTRYRIIDRETQRAERSGRWTDGQFGLRYDPGSGPARAFPTRELALFQLRRIARRRGHQPERYRIEVAP